jgi:hypothetical protein
MKDRYQGKSLNAKVLECWSVGTGGKRQKEMVLQVLNGKVLALEWLYTKWEEIIDGLRNEQTKWRCSCSCPHPLGGSE